MDAFLQRAVDSFQNIPKMSRNISAVRAKSIQAYLIFTFMRYKQIAHSNMSFKKIQINIHVMYFIKAF